MNSNKVLELVRKRKEIKQYYMHITTVTLYETSNTYRTIDDMIQGENMNVTSDEYAKRLEFAENERLFFLMTTPLFDSIQPTYRVVNHDWIKKECVLLTFDEHLFFTDLLQRHDTEQVEEMMKQFIIIKNQLRSDT